MTAAGKPAKSKAAPDKFKAVGRLRIREYMAVYTEIKQPNGRKREIEMKTNFEGKEFTLTQEAYYNAGTGMYEAHAVDESGKEYKVYFEIIDGHEDDEWEDTMCDWDNASDVQEI